MFIIIHKSINVTEDVKNASNYDLSVTKLETVENDLCQNDYNIDFEETSKDELGVPIILDIKNINTKQNKVLEIKEEIVSDSEFDLDSDEEIIKTVDPKKLCNFS
jgi:hypothetical protein